MSYPPLPPQTNQPGQWMPMPNVNLNNLHPSLAYLTQVDHLMIKQQVEMLEAFTGFETANKYNIKNTAGQTVFFAAEDSGCCTRMCCGPLRDFEMKILDNTQNEVIHISRPLACDSCCFPCSRQSIEVSSPAGTVVGTVKKDWSICVPKFSVKNAEGETVLKIEGPLCTMAMCGNIEFEVLSADGSTQVGKISKNWSGFGKEMFTDADTFGVSFPMDLDVKIKAVLLGAVFLIDFIYFEKKN